MTRIFSTTILLLLAGALSPPTFSGSATVPEPVALHVGIATADTVHVAPPTGETEADPATGDPDSLPRARPNDHRTPAGRSVDGELRVELEAVEAAWYPRGPDGPRIVTPAFAERGRAPRVPGPLIRTSADTPVRVSVRNTLERRITVRGLVDRADMELPEELPDGAEPGDPRFFFADSLVVPPGATREIRFTPTAAVSSFYYGRRAAPEGGSVNNGFFPGNFGDEGVFLGAFVVDPAGASDPPDERIMLISRWAGREEPSTLTATFKMMINGLSWPFTERLRYPVGDTVRWRVINTSVIEHPMHLHGHYFHVDARGDADADTVYARAERPLVVTDVMPDFSSLRLSWVPDRPGNWLFHCHLIRHMGSAQRFTGEEGKGSRHDMAGLVMGLTVDPAPGDATGERLPSRTIHLWTASTPGVFDDRPALSFVAREDASAPPEDTLLVPGSPLVLERGEPTGIVLHNRLDFPISVHWHGLEVRSVYDGVGHWSGHPGATRPPVAPGDSATVQITPPRAGTFIYHVHGEPGHELSQGLYGPFLVLPEGEGWRERDRVFVLAARGAERDPPPVVNGDELPPPERFAPGGDYRLRFIHISPDASKRVRLLKDGEPVRWRPLAKDGADLPERARAPVAAEVELGVGETFDAGWAPAEPGAYTLEVVTTHYSASGLPPTVQRVAFGVGEVADETLAEAVRVEPPPPPPPSHLDTVPAVELEEERLRRLVGTWTAPGVPVDFVVGRGEGGLWMSVTGREPQRLVPLSPTLFRWEDEPSVRVEVEQEEDEVVLVVFGRRLRRNPEGAGGSPSGRGLPAGGSDPGGGPAADSVRIAPPTGEVEADRASILAALDAVQPGGIIQFAPGTYMVGEFIRVSVPRVTLQGHPDGTTLRGCDSSAFEDVQAAMVACSGLALIGERQTVRGLTFEHMWQALWVGCCLEPAEGEDEPGARHVGGHLVEGNTFRASVNGFRVIGDSPEPVVVRDNDFVNVWHAGGVNGRTAHILGNRISVPDAADVPPNGFPGLALFITPYDTRLDKAFTCAGNIVAGNRVEGHPEGIGITVFRSGASCRENVIRDNTIRVERVRFTGTPWGVTGIGDPADSTLAGVPIALSDLSAQMSEIIGVPAEPGDEVLIQDNLLEGNRIVGAEGLGIEILGASDNRIVDNTITRVAVRDPFPGNTMYVPPPWGEANGSGIWVSPGSDGNEIVGNTFENVAGAAVSMEGGDNRLELRSPTDSVRDLGTDNEVSVADGAEGSDVAAAERVAGAADTVHVPPPTGDRETDRSSVLVALEEVQPGGTILFGQGPYLIGGEIIRVTVPRITLLGHPEGTTLRGCDPGEFPWDDLTEFGNNCNAIELAAGQQTVRNLTFEHAMWALHVGCCWSDRPGFEAGDGGHLIEGNTFRNSSNGVRVHGFWTEPTVIRNNRFLNNWHSVAIYGNTVHLLDNDISAPEPEKVQLLGFPGDAIHIGPPAPLHDSVQGVMRTCENNVVADNRIDGTTEGIMVMADDETPCRNNVIRDNTIAIRRARPAAIPGFIGVHDDTDETVVGVPLALRGAVVDNLIEGNVINGAEGLGIEIRNASRNRIVSNTVTRVLQREPFPGNAIAALPILGGDPNAWRDANGSAIWISPGSDGNQIVGNTFEDVAGAEVFLEGDRNRVTLRSAADSMRDLGTGNEVTVSGVGFRTIDIDGNAVRIYSRGLESRAGGSPVVVLEGPIEVWTGVLEALGDTVAFLAYDPPGLGQSEWNDERPTPERMSEWAHGVLDVAGAEPPYVLVGHSWSGWNVRAFEGRYPSDVAGLVLVDPTGPNAGFQAAFDEVEAGPPGSAEFRRLVEGMLAGAPSAVRARQQVIDEYRRSGTDPNVPEAPSVPFVVLSAGRYDSTELPGSEGLSFDVAAFFRALRRQQTTAHADLVKGSANGTHVLADDSPHCIHCAEPDLVARAIERVLTAVDERE